MLKKIKKRNGNIVKFDSSKITSAIRKAGNGTGQFGKTVAKTLTLRVLALAHELGLGPAPEVEEIQDIIEVVLLNSSFKNTAKAYIIYREQHAQIRGILAKKNVDLVETYIREKDRTVRENSNMNYSLQGPTT